MRRTIHTMPLLCAVALLLTHLLVACSETKEQSVARLDGKTMGTYWQVSVATKLDAATKQELAQKINVVLKEVNHEMSTYDPDSEISRFNRSHDTDAHQISAGFLRNVEAAQRISAASDGVYDITVAPLVNLWGFGPDKVSHAPTQAQIDAARQRVGYRQLHTDARASTLRKDRPDVTIDLSSIAKGYGVDSVAATLDANGYHNYLVDIGGELLAKGNKNGEPWRVGVEKPVAGQHVEEVLNLPTPGTTQTAMATSGNYRNYIDYDGKRAVHTIDPRTGHSVQSTLLSVSVIAPSCMEADGYATALMALGKDAAAFADKQQIPALFIYADPQDKTRFIVTRNAQWQQAFGE